MTRYLNTAEKNRQKVARAASADVARAADADSLRAVSVKARATVLRGAAEAVTPDRTDVIDLLDRSAPDVTTADAALRSLGLWAHVTHDAAYACGWADSCTPDELAAGLRAAAAWIVDQEATR